MAGIDIDSNYDSIDNISNSNNNNNNNNNINNVNLNKMDNGLTNDCSMDINGVKNVRKSSIALLSVEEVVTLDIYYCLCTLILGFIFFFPWFYSSLYMFDKNHVSLKKMGFASILLIQIYLFIFFIAFLII